MLASSVLALAGGCMPGDFGAALDKAPVQVMGAPDGFGSSADLTLLPLPPPADPNRPNLAARLLFAGTDAASVALADFDGDGKPQVQAVSGDKFDTLLGLDPSQPGQGISSAARLIGSTAVGSAAAEIIVLGMPNLGSSLGQGTVAFLTLGVDASGNADFESAGNLRYGLSTESQFGLVVASGRVTQAAADEAIVVSDSGVHVLGFPTGDVVSNASCALVTPGPQNIYRSLAVGNFLLDSDGGTRQEIAVGLANTGGTAPGRVVILQYNAGAVGLSCPIELSVPGGNSPGFGTALAVVPHLNGDGMADLVVGAPPDHAYLFHSPLNGTTLTNTFTRSDPSLQFGQRLALVHIEADGTQQGIAITALQANLGSTKNAEQVLVYKLNGDGITPVAVVDDSALTVTGNTDFGLAELEFNSSLACAKGQVARVLVAGADAGIFTFFRLAGPVAPTTVLAPDPRCFAQK
jgi:hypothetical protein